MKFTKSDTVGLIVASNIETATVFNSHGINFYSRGDRTLEEACIEDNVPIVTLFDDLYDIVTTHPASPNFRDMNLKALVAYIIRTHHRYTERKLVFIKHTMENLISQYEEADPALYDVKKAFEDLSVHLTVHMNHEEFIVFPIIVKLAKSKTLTATEYRAIAQPIASMKTDHQHELEKLKGLVAKTQRYAKRNYTDYAYTIGRNAMVEFENDLKIHMHLENNILFPKAIDFAQRIRKANDVSMN